MSSPKTRYLADYQPPDFTIPSTQLLFKLGLKTTIVIGEFQVMRLRDQEKTLWLDGEDLELHAVYCDGVKLAEDMLLRNEGQLGIPCDQDRALIKIEVAISPEKNTRLQGLYVSGTSLCTQCEAEGFRRIMYSLDRPDVMSTYDVAVIYDINQFPLVVVAGHCQERKSLSHGYEYVRYVDLTPKPTYLFAMIAGYFHTLEDQLTTRDNKEVQLFIHLPIQYATTQVTFAMDALKKSMIWDERTFNCIYDLDVYHIAGFPDFNFGAMENKGLNIFNTSALLADPNITTDNGYLRVLSVVGHEYFHNWTGNRVGCANWFQLSLKEGLTTYREMRFACDSYGPTARLEYIESLVEAQFKEDRGPTAHAVIPDSYQKIDNFYTSTIYTKGSEILRMLEDIIGRECIDKGIEQYLAKYDGKAVTIHEFLDTMSAVSGYDLSQFIRWYKQVGTPSVQIGSKYNAKEKTLTLTITQQASKPERQAAYMPLIIPIRARLWSEAGRMLLPEKNDELQIADDGSWVAVLKQERAEICIRGIEHQPVIASFIGLSAPVCHSEGYDFAEKACLVAFETDPYVKMQSAKECWLKILSETDGGIPESFRQCLDTVIASWKAAPELLPLVFAMPSLPSCQEGGRVFHFDALVKRHRQLTQEIAVIWEAQWLEIFQSCAFKLKDAYRWSRGDATMRRLQALSLAMLLNVNFEKYQGLASRLYETADNLTTRCNVLSAVLNHSNDYSDQLLERFYTDAEDHDLVINKWLYYAAYRKQNSLKKIQNVYEDLACDLRQPNRIVSWFSGWRAGNYELMHDRDGRGYDLLQMVITQLDEINPFTAARLIGSLLNWQYFDDDRQVKMRQALENLIKHDCSAVLKEKILSAV